MRSASHPPASKFIRRLCVVISLTLAACGGDDLQDQGDPDAESEVEFDSKLGEGATGSSAVSVESSEGEGASQIPDVQDDARAPIELADGLVAHFPLDGDATDSAGQSSGTLFGATPIADRFGRSAGALHFDGVDDYVEIPHTEALSLDHEFSITTWISHREQPQSTWYTIFEKSDPERGGHSRWGLWVLDDEMWLCYEAGDGSGQPCGVAEGTIPYDDWHHIAAVRSSGDAVLYVDGVEIGRDAIGDIAISQTPFLSYIGADLYATVPVFLDADLDDLRIYERALTSDEVVRLASDR